LVNARKLAWNVKKKEEWEEGCMIRGNKSCAIVKRRWR
jgi:hypothetical protein